MTDDVRVIVRIACTLRQRQLLFMGTKMPQSPKIVSSIFHTTHSSRVHAVYKFKYSRSPMCTRLGQCKTKKTTHLKTWAVNKHQMPLHWSAGKSQKQRKHAGRVDRTHAALCRSCRERTRSTSSWMGKEGWCTLLHLHTCMKVAVMEGLSSEDKQRCTLTLIYIDDSSQSQIPDMENLVFPRLKKKKHHMCLCKWDAGKVNNCVMCTKYSFVCLCVRLYVLPHRHSTK